MEAVDWSLQAATTEASMLPLETVFTMLSIYSGCPETSFYEVF